MLGAIAFEGSRRTRWVGERHIAVRSKQIDCVTRQTGRLVLRSPVKDVQRYVVTGAPGRQLGAGQAIDVDLPGHRREGFEIVLPIVRHPRQPVAAVNMTGSASA